MKADYPRRTNGFAVAALVLGILMSGITSVLAIIFGFIARAQIKRSQDAERGRGIATAGIVLGFVGIAASILLAIVVSGALKYNEPGFRRRLGCSVRKSCQRLGR